MALMEVSESAAFNDEVVASLRRNAATQPEFFYHGTTSSNAKQIMVVGLHPTTEQNRIHKDFNSLHEVHVTDSEKTARFFALAASVDTNSRLPNGELDPGVVLVIDRQIANDRDVWFHKNEGRLDPSYRGAEWGSWFKIPPEAIVREIRLIDTPHKTRRKTSDLRAE